MGVEFEGYSVFSGHSSEPVAKWDVVIIDGTYYPVDKDGDADLPIGTKLSLCKKPVSSGLNYCCFPETHYGPCNYFSVHQGGIYKFSDGQWAYYHPHWVKMQKKKAGPVVLDAESTMWDE